MDMSSIVLSIRLVLGQSGWTVTFSECSADTGPLTGETVAASLYLNTLPICAGSEKSKLKLILVGSKLDAGAGGSLSICTVFVQVTGY